MQGQNSRSSRIEHYHHYVMLHIESYEQWSLKAASFYSLCRMRLRFVDGSLIKLHASYTMEEKSHSRAPPAFEILVPQLGYFHICLDMTC